MKHKSLMGIRTHAIVHSYCLHKSLKYVHVIIVTIRNTSPRVGFVYLMSKTIDDKKYYLELITM